MKFASAPERFPAAHSNTPPCADATRGHNTQGPSHARLATRLATAVAAAALTVMATGPGIAQSGGDGVYLAGAERIDLSEQLRMLSQRVPAAACYIDAGIEVDMHRTVMQASIARFDTLLTSLKDGSDALGISRHEDDRKMLAAIRGVLLQWEPFRVEAQTRIGVGTAAPGPDFVSRQNLNLMHVSKNLTGEVINHYSIPPALLQGDAFTLQIVGRQRALTQKLSKEVCGVLTGNSIMGNMLRLRRTVTQFDLSFNALLNGLPAAGVSPPATPEIRAGLEAMTAEWNSLKSDLLQITPAAGADGAQDFYLRLESLMKQYDALVPLYVTESKSGI